MIKKEFLEMNKDVKKEEAKKMDKVITSLMFSKKTPLDRPLLTLINRYCELNPKNLPKTTMRNLLYDVLPRKIQQLESGDKKLIA